MGQNDGCALEKLVDGYWIPTALRYQRFAAPVRQALDRGEEVIQEGTTWRRRDWAERRALLKALLSCCPT